MNVSDRQAFANPHSARRMVNRQLPESCDVGPRARMVGGTGLEPVTAGV